MPTNTESLNRELFRLLSKYKPKPLDAEGKATPVPEEADVFKFEFTKDGEEYGTVYVTLDDERVLTVYFGDDVSDSPGDKTPGIDYDDTWSGLLHQLSSWRMTKGLRGFKTQNKDRVSDDMARRNHMRNKDKIAEGYYATGKKSSYSDAVPSVKIVIEHSRVIEEGEQRYRNINRIFLENQAGERYLLDTKKPGIARVYARHIAEGGKVNDDRWSHIGNLCEEYQKMAGFVRATRNGQFNESAQSLVNEGIEHYVSLRESLSRMTGKRGYNAYFESWTPPLMEDGTEENNLNELFVQETLDPRIESVMPILNRIHKKVSESVVDKEMNKLAEWADSLVEEESLTSNNPVGIPEDRSLNKELEQRQKEKGVTEEQLNEFAPLLAAGARLFMAAAPKIAQVVGKAGQAGARGVGQAAKAGTEIAAKNAGQIGIGAGAYEIGSSVADIAKDITAKVGTALDEKTLLDLAALAFKYAIPAGIVLTILYGGKKAIDSLFADPKTQQGAANENFINQADQAVTSEGEHTQHAMRGRNPGANEFEHDFEPKDKIGNIHDKISRMLKRLEKPKDKEPNMKDTDLGSTVLESEERPYVCVHAKKGKCEVKASSSYQAAQKAAQKWGLKGTAGIDAHLADVKKDTSSLEESTDELARILTIMNHRR